MPEVIVIRSNPSHASTGAPEFVTRSSRVLSLVKGALKTGLAGRISYRRFPVLLPQPPAGNAKTGNNQNRFEVHGCSGRLRALVRVNDNVRGCIFFLGNLRPKCSDKRISQTTKCAAGIRITAGSPGSVCRSRRWYITAGNRRWAGTGGAKVCDGFGKDSAAGNQCCKFR